VLVLILLRGEGSTVRWSDVRSACGCSRPTDRAGRTDRRCGGGSYPLILVSAVYAMMVSGAVEALLGAPAAFFAEPPSFSMAGFMDSPESKAAMVGNWGLFLLFIIQMLFNTVLGEELLWRGLLLPRMAGAFGKWDWLANGVLFGFYHWHQPWACSALLSTARCCMRGLPGDSGSAWFGNHRALGQSVYFCLPAARLVLGLA